MTDKPSSPPSTLHGILVELGLEPPQPLEDQADAPERAWSVDKAFIPVPGLRYEVVFGPSGPPGTEQQPVRLAIRADGVRPEDWIDLARERPISKELQATPVRAFRLLE